MSAATAPAPISHDLQFSVEGAASPTGAMDGTHAAPPPATPLSKLSLQNSSKPTVCLFHILFKVMSLALYVFGGFFAGKGKHSSFIVVTVFCVLLLAADFWVTKNITGRLLVGLRWWNQVEGDTTKWIFESKEHDEAGTSMANAFDKNFFWTVLYVTPCLWAGLLILGVLRLEVGWLIVVVMALSMSAANVYGYYQCSKDQKAKFQQMMVQGAQQGAMAAFQSNMFGMLAGRKTNDNNNSGAYANANAGGAPPAQTYV